MNVRHMNVTAINQKRSQGFERVKRVIREGREEEMVKFSYYNLKSKIKNKIKVVLCPLVNSTT